MRRLIPWLLIAILIATLRFFLANWLEPRGISPNVGSHLASLWVLLLVAILVFFSKEGSKESGTYWSAAWQFLVLATWCELLVITGILITDWAGIATYYQGPWESVKHAFPTAREHAIGHAQGFWVRAVAGLILGLMVYAFTRRLRRRARSAKTSA